MARVNIDILGISELKWTRMGKSNSDDHSICYCGQEPLRIHGAAVIVNNSAVLECNLKNDRMISIPFQGERISLLIILCNVSEWFSILQIV